ncbi:uncharacterized protein LOC128865797 [Anastrepha ludens]|uniref:uncharacterized protein LOC128865797 n=1 Tax=Anastrepha ludens TaxID=28586 RepID=UPI0023AFB314|nr:uncharacterized protein LOC128865797 [Anastrepha ludens]
MFRLRIAHTQFKFGFQIYRNYLSNEYKSALSYFDTHSPHVNNVRSKGLAAQGIIQIDIVDGIAHDENRNNEFSESLLKLRSEPQKSATFEATNYAIFRNFIDHENIDELLPLLKNRLESGLFIDDFLGCYLLNHFLQKQNYLAAAEIGLEFFKQETLENKLVVGLILKSFLEYLKQNIEQINAPVATETKKPTKKSDEIKVRVKFIRNTEDNTTFAGEIGRAICRIAELNSNDVTANFKLLGTLLVNKKDLALSLLDGKNINFCKDTLQYSQTLLKNMGEVDEKITNAINSSLEQTADSPTLDVLLSAFLEAARKEEVKLIEQQKKKYTFWKEQDVVEREKNVNTEPPSQRKERIEQILADVAQKKQKLWYFENEELVDLEIFKKNKTYPKKWFGKKKKPRVVDENYVPPEINRKSV